MVIISVNIILCDTKFMEEIYMSVDPKVNSGY